MIGGMILELKEKVIKEKRYAKLNITEESIQPLKLNFSEFLLREIFVRCMIIFFIFSFVGIL